MFGMTDLLLGGHSNAHSRFPRIILSRYPLPACRNRTIQQDALQTYLIKFVWRLKLYFTIRSGWRNRTSLPSSLSNVNNCTADRTCYKLQVALN